MVFAVDAADDIKMVGAMITDHKNKRFGTGDVKDKPFQASSKKWKV